MADLVQTQPQALTRIGEGFENLGPTPIANMTLAQGNSRKGTPGKFYDTLSGAEFEELTIVPLSSKPSRVYFPAGEIGADPICRSNDGVYPVSEAELGHPPINHDCATCPESSWEGYNSRTGTGVKPRCKEQRRLLFIERASGLPYRLTLSGMSLSPLKKVLQSIQRDAIMAQAKGETRNIFDYSFSIKPLRVTSKTGFTFYVVEFGLAVAMRESDRGRFGPLYEQLVKRADAEREAQEIREELKQEVDAGLPDY